MSKGSRYSIDLSRTIKKRVMKYLLKGAIRRISQVDPVWRLLRRTLLPAAFHARMGRLEKRMQAPGAFRELLDDLTVKHGPFSGLKYPDSTSADGCFYPKLLGSFEREIQSLVEKMCQKSFDAVLNIGCSEGFYAVGFAMRMPETLVYAYDADPNSLKMCEEMAKVNGVSERVRTGPACTSQSLRQLNLPKEALIFCDCEGCEKEIFTHQNAEKWKTHHLIIEVHDLFDIEISDYLKNLFEPTHELTVYRSTDDIHKAREYDFPELEGFDLATRKLILAENRESIMEWFHFSPRS